MKTFDRISILLKS